MADRNLREDALAIWRAGLEAVRSDRLVRENVRVEGDELAVGETRLSLRRIRRIVVVGAGKAGSGMAAGLEEALGPRILREKQVAGWVNAPEDCVRPLQAIRLHAARPAGVNEPTESGVRGAEEILRLVGSLGPDDLCLCLISGGGSALLPAPVEGITLADKQAVTRHLSAAGANIQELNTVRKRLSRIKGGGLARACRAGRLISLIISDVLGDPLDMIASGPTVPDPTPPQAALEVLERFEARKAGIAPRVFEYLERTVGNAEQAPQSSAPNVENIIIGNLAVAVDAAGVEAERRGYSHAMNCAVRPEGEAEEIGRHLAQMALRMRSEGGPDCLITGGEPTVRLAPQAHRGKGGRNQQLILAALEYLVGNRESGVAQIRNSECGMRNEERSAGLHSSNPHSALRIPHFTTIRNPLDGLALLSGGTDGEDGPTDAAGALIDAEVWQAAQKQNLDPSDFLRRNDAYHFFQPTGGLIRTGPTHTNVCDVRVVVVSRR